MVFHAEGSVPRVGMADSDAESSVPVMLEDLDDALLLHTLSFMSRVSLGCCSRISSRWARLVTDGTVWQRWLQTQYGSTAAPFLQPTAPPRAADCATFYDSARRWFAFATSIGVAAEEPCPQLSHIAGRAGRAWDRLSEWSRVHLPAAHAALGPPATQHEWQRALQRLSVASEVNVEANALPILSLRVLYAICDGQRFGDDLQEAANNLDDEQHRELIEEMVKEAQRDGWQHNAQGSSFLGLGGGFSAYDLKQSVKLLPLSLITAWTLIFRQHYQLPRRCIVVGLSLLCQQHRYLIASLTSGDLYLGHVQPTPTLGQRKIMRCGAIQVVRAVPLSTPRGSDMLAWLEELGARLEANTYLASPILPTESSTRGLCLFPQRTPKCAPLSEAAVGRQPSTALVASPRSQPPRPPA